MHSLEFGGEGQTRPDPRGLTLQNQITWRPIEKLILWNNVKLKTKGKGLESSDDGCREVTDSRVTRCDFYMVKNSEVDSRRYLATQGDLYRNGNHLSQQTAVEGHHEGHRVVVRKHQRHLREEREDNQCLKCQKIGEKKGQQTISLS